MPAPSMATSLVPHVRNVPELIQRHRDRYFPALTAISIQRRLPTRRRLAAIRAQQRLGTAASEFCEGPFNGVSIWPSRALSLYRNMEISSSEPSSSTLRTLLTSACLSAISLPVQPLAELLPRRLIPGLSSSLSNTATETAVWPERTYENYEKRTHREP